MDHPTLAEFIRQRRKELGLTQDQLAQKIGTKTAYVGQIETGKPKWPQVLVPALARVLRVKQAYLAALAGLIEFEDVEQEQDLDDPRLVMLIDDLRRMNPDQWQAIQAYGLLLADPRFRDPEFIKGAQKAAQ